MSTIEDRLWMDLICEPEADAALRARQPSAAHRRPGRGPLAAGGLVLLGATLAVVLTLKASTGTPPAYAVAVNRDGSVRLTLNQVFGVRGANEALAKLGVRARVAQIEAGCTQTGEIDRSHDKRLLVEPRKTPAGGTSIAAQLRRPGGAFAGVDLIIHADAIPQGDTLLIAAQLNPAVRYQGRAIPSAATSWGLYRGAAPTCDPPFWRRAGRAPRG
jgi:hypothetical protein